MKYLEFRNYIVSKYTNKYGIEQYTQARRELQLPL